MGGPGSGRRKGGGLSKAPFTGIKTINKAPYTVTSRGLMSKQRTSAANRLAQNKL